MHSSRMRTARSFTISRRGVYLPRGCTCRGYLPGVYLPKWVYLPGGCTCLGAVPAQVGVPAQGDVPAWGLYLPMGGVPAQVLPPVNRMTNRCKNITLPQTSFAGGNYLLVVTELVASRAQYTDYFDYKFTIKNVTFCLIMSTIYI